MKDPNDDEVEVTECSNCHYKINDLMKIERTHGEKMGCTWYLCKVCRETFAGNAYEFPRYYDAQLYGTIAYIGNMILAEIRKNK